MRAHAVHFAQLALQKDKENSPGMGKLFVGVVTFSLIFVIVYSVVVVV